ncbi:MAG: VanW family protein [Clostridia bacterium]|nr:VanW family protein [Clostridia bacterium]
MPRIGKWRNSNKSAGVFAVTATVVAMFFVLGAVLMFLSKSFGFPSLDKHVYPGGTTVEGVDIGGMTPAEAKDALSGVENDFISSYSCTLRSPDSDEKKHVFTSEDYTVRTDIENVLESAEDGGSYSLSYVISAQSIKRCLLDIADDYEVQPQPYEIKFDKSFHPHGERFTLAEGSDGQELDIDSCVESIMRGETDIEAPMTVTSNKGVIPSLPVLIGSYKTSFKGRALAAPNRVYNIKKAAEIINGSVVDAFKTFSCNDALGNRTEKAGWRLAPGITEGGADTEDQPGGGVCQVSSTLFNAVLYADMEIVERRSHSKQISYCEGGRDATIDSGSIDFVWKNTGSAPVYVFVWADEDAKELLCEIYGSPKTDYEIDIEAVLTEEIPPSEDEYILDETLSSNARVEDNPPITGYVYKTYRVYYKDGVEQSRELVAESHYNMHPRRFRVGRSYYKKLNATAAPISSPKPSKTPKPASSTPAAATQTPASPTNAPTSIPTAPPTPDTPSEAPETPPPSESSPPSPTEDFVEP